MSSEGSARNGGTAGLVMDSCSSMMPQMIQMMSFGLSGECSTVVTRGHQ